ncbi:glycoside hydrolase family 105 protein [Saccharata proteae CBS 121410]|uniref:Glycoside hydrolase family 105 protein n=1 Tax=Saccharata proteae CBS 121410 TaxID=1314787 RepID=A0A9P4HU27_9PEZI|nr:glycoside hydrolase family 105 protein [Saccharata proteae CBS 121410]
MPPASLGLDALPIHSKILLLKNKLVNITDPSGEFLLRLPDGRVIDTKGWASGWDWTHGVGLYGLYQYYLLTDSSEIKQIMLDWYEVRLAEGTTKNINTMSVFLTLAYLYEDPATRDRRWLPWLESWADWAMHGLPRTPFGGMQHITYAEENKNQLWTETLIMTVMPLAKIGKVLDRPQYVEEAKRQFLVHMQFLLDTGTGLFYHGWKFDDEAPGGLGHNFAKARWARGNAWVTMAIPDFVELLDLPEGDSLRRYLLDILQAQCQALARLQNSKGLWKTLLDVSEEEGSYVESSATAGFAYGILKAVRKRYIPRKYRSIALNAVEAILQKITKDGDLQDTSFGTGMGKNYRYYFEIPRTSMPYGQAMAIMALGEFLRSFV